MGYVNNIERKRARNARYRARHLEKLRARDRLRKSTPPPARDVEPVTCYEFTRWLKLPPPELPL
jgi:hypothetical protein